jgi:hypothetical protein
MADSGKASKVVVKRLVGDIDYFAESVKEDAAKMLREAEDLQAYWNDPQYQNFLSFMRDLTDELVKDTANLDYVARKIEERELKGL